jgi:DNA invertase Pin-like site-specific DNA recombinase
MLRPRHQAERKDQPLTSLELSCALYARVSTLDQEPENQLRELKTYADRRGWRVEPYIDNGVTGTKQSRPELDRLLRDARRRTFDVLLCWRLDRLGRNLTHLVFFLDELAALGVHFVSLGESIDSTTPEGRLQMQVLAAIAEFERERLSERVRAGLTRARAQGQRHGRPRAPVPTERLLDVADLTVDAAAASLGVSRSTLKRWRTEVQKTSPKAI